MGRHTPPRVGVTMAAVGNPFYVFGGRDAKHKELNELYSFDTDTNKWALITSGDTGLLTGVTARQLLMTGMFTSSAAAASRAGSIISGHLMLLTKSACNSLHQEKTARGEVGQDGSGPKQNMGCLWVLRARTGRCPLLGPGP